MAINKITKFSEIVSPINKIDEVIDAINQLDTEIDNTNSSISDLNSDLLELDTKVDQLDFSEFTGATSESDGIKGMVPAPTKEEVKKYLCADGTWKEPVSASIDEDLLIIKAELGYPGIEDIYGLEADFVNNVFTRLAGAVGKNAGADFNSCNAFGGRRRCNLTDDGIVTAYYGEEGFVTNGITDRELKGKPAGTHVQVMVEQPKFYYKVDPVELVAGSRANEKHTNIVRYYVSDTNYPGFKTHPAFIVNGVEKDKIYLAAFEGCLYDVSASSYITNDSQVADFTETTGDKASSIAGIKPMSGLSQNLTRANARKLTHNRGAGWEQSYLATVAATQLLMIIEYGQFNIQEVLGIGVSGKTDNGSSNMSENTGATISLGNNSGEATQGSYKHISYRGEENFYGNIWTWVDGLNQNSGAIYISDHNFKDDTSEAPYVPAGYCLTSSEVYPKKFEYNDSYSWLFIPGATGGNSSLPIGDYYWYNSGWRVAGLGGRWDSGSSCGPFCWSLSNASSNRKRNIGLRLVYIP